MKIHLTFNGNVIAATLADNRIAEEFVAMLPLTIDLHDFFGREKFGALPSAVSGEGTQSRNYDVGDIVCWAPGPDLSILYRQDGEPLEGAWHFLGRIDEGVESHFGEHAGTFRCCIPVHVEQDAAREVVCGDFIFDDLAPDFRHRQGGRPARVGACQHCL